MNSPEVVHLKSLVDREDLREDLREELRNDYFPNVLNCCELEMHSIL